MKYPRIIYYDKETGMVLHNTGEPFVIGVENYEGIRVESDYKNIKVLSERNRYTIGELHLELGQYAQDFAKCSCYRINPETLELEFAYPVPSKLDPVELTYYTPLTEQVNELKQAVVELTLLIATP
ncbi:hypothetical protein M3201_13540 [Paenibacillus motobuensis]|uniref:hypothetical protein n=1 Tax=Paenibacillus TaxID=44249 RepID=UPI00203ECC49|nr:MULTISPECIES: hypothetical protein [Paenibacillus]MCM3040721.1 hypothetical protein [Paenibacillus lutimineralis]MCM3647825.1 hypothetical protein [Paenibacillus motobuensis]